MIDSQLEPVAGLVDRHLREAVEHACAVSVARLDCALLPVVLAFDVAIPVVAAVRDDPWWLAPLLPGAIAILAIRPIWPSQDPLASN